MGVGTLVTQVKEVAAVSSRTKAIVVHLEDPAQARAAQEAFGALLTQGDLPPVFIFSGDVGLTGQKGGEVNLGLFIGMTELADLLQKDGEEIKAALLELVSEV